MSGEHARMMAAEGNGEVFYGHAGLYVEVIHLDGSSMLTVEADRLLAHDGYLQSSIVALTSQGGVRGAVRGAMTGQGLFTTQLHGQGSVAVLSHGGRDSVAGRSEQSSGRRRPAGIRVPHRSDQRRHLRERRLARGRRQGLGGESIQLKMTGAGTVWVQASEQKF